MLHKNSENEEPIKDENAGLLQNKKDQITNAYASRTVDVSLFQWRENNTATSGGHTAHR